MSLPFNPLNLPPLAHNDDYHLTTAKRDTAGGVAGLDASKLILNENRPVTTAEINLTAGMLDPTTDPDRWVGTVGTGVRNYSAGVLTLTGSVGSDCVNRCRFPIVDYTSTLIELTYKVDGFVEGEGGNQYSYIGFTSNPSVIPADPNRFVITQCHTVYPGSTRIISSGSAHPYLDTLPIGRDLTDGDIFTIRLENGETAKYYVNNVLQFENDIEPTANLYPFIMQYNTSGSTTASSMSTRYIGMKVVP